MKTAHKSWFDACYSLEQQGQAYCLATVIAQKGSVPGTPGSKMVITENGQSGTLGGGYVEFEVINKARQQLKVKDASKVIHTEHFSLNNQSEQVCGGELQVLFEYRNLNRPDIVIFGAGHVSQALCPILNELPCNIIVADSRSDWLREIENETIRTQLYDKPEEVTEALCDNSYILIMTHEHRLDFEIARAALERQCFPYIGMIGSQKKKQQAEKYLSKHLSDPELLSNLTCPVGHPDIRGKLPMQVAVSISAQLLMLCF